VKRMRKSRPNLHCLQEFTQGYAAFSPTQGIGFSRKISFALGLFMACQRSQSCCKPNQKSADIPNTRDSRNAVSGVTERRPLMISLRRGYLIGSSLRLALSIFKQELNGDLTTSVPLKGCGFFKCGQILPLYIFNQ